MTRTFTVIDYVYALDDSSSMNQLSHKVAPLMCVLYAMVPGFVDNRQVFLVDDHQRFR
jgi:hypothetical protein